MSNIKEEIEDYLETNIPAVKKAYNDAKQFADLHQMKVFTHMTNSGICIYVSQKRFSELFLFHGKDPETDPDFLVNRILFDVKHGGENIHKLLPKLKGNVLIFDEETDDVRELIKFKK